MRILHVFSNWKLTGPAEPAIRIAESISRKGHDVSFLSGIAPEGNKSAVRPVTDEAGITLDAPVRLGKHRSFFSNWRDARRLRELLTAGSYDIIHCHMPNDTRIALAAVKDMADRPAVVRCVYCGDMDEITSAEKKMLRRTDGVCAVSGRVAQCLVSCGGMPEVCHIGSGIDLIRFDIGRHDSTMRSEWGIDDNRPVVGVIGRLQKKRKYDVIFSGFKSILEKIPDALLVIVGRGTAARDVAEKLPEHLGIAENTLRAGYLSGDDYVRTVCALDALVYLVPGTDGTCRTVREAMACSVPVVSSRRGMLEEIVEDGVTGYCVGETAESVCTALCDILLDRDKRKAMGLRSRERAEKLFSLENQAKLTLQLYSRMETC